jgi:hypothetical protein
MSESQIPPVDRTKRCMTSGNPETPDHREEVPCECGAIARYPKALESI